MGTEIMQRLTLVRMSKFSPSHNVFPNRLYKKSDNAKLARAEWRIGQLEMELDLVKKERVHCQTKKELVEYLSGQTYHKIGCGYPMVKVFLVAGCSSPNWYEKHEQLQSEKRGMKPSVSDHYLLIAIRKVIAESLFHCEGYIKIWKKLAKRNISTYPTAVLTG